MKAMLSIDNKLFEKARSLNLIDDEQLEMVLDFQKNPRDSMRNFLINNPNFLNNLLEKDSKTRERAQLCINQNIYQII